MIPLMLGATGSVETMMASAPEGFFTLTGGGYGYFFILGWALIHIFMIGAEWAFTQRFISVPTASDARKSAYLFGALYLISPVLWLAPPLIFRLIEPGVPQEEAYILAAKSVLPAGMIGLMFAAMFSATASMISSQLNVFAAVLSDPLVRRLSDRGASERDLVWVSGAFITVVIGVALIGLSVAVPHLGGAEKLVISSTSLLVGPLFSAKFLGDC